MVTDSITKTSPRVGVTDRAADWMRRSRVGSVLIRLGRRPVPTHWSFIFAEVALYSFLVVIISGLYLMFFYDPSSTVVVYGGSYAPLQGIEVSRALDSTLHISFEVRGGLLIRQAHHWAALLMIAAIVVHLLAVFFTGGFRRPRQLNWLVAVAVFVLSLIAGWTGYALPDDMLSGSGLRIVHGVILGIPVVGTWLSFLVFGGEFPSNIIGNFYPVHVVIVPVAIIALVGLYIALIASQRPAQFPGPGRTNDNVVGVPLFPAYATKTGGLMLIVVAIILLISATVTINPVWSYGPSSPGDATAGSQPDWYMGFLDGALRLVPPGWEIVVFDRTITLSVLVPLAVVGVFMTAVAIYPFFEEWVVGGREEYNILDRPRNAPTRTGLGVAGIVFYGALWGAASADIAATRFQVSIESVIHFYQATLVVGPIVGFLVAREIALSLQRKDQEVLAHGFETGRIVRLPGGEYIEVNQPVNGEKRSQLAAAGPPPMFVPQPSSPGHITLMQRLRVRLSSLFFEQRIVPQIEAKATGVTAEEEDDAAVALAPIAPPQR